MLEQLGLGDWAKVMNEKALIGALSQISPKKVCPTPNLVFEAFKRCPLNECKVLFLGQDPYPQSGVATGIAFGNSAEPISPSLQVLKDAAIDYTRPHNLPIEFDITLNSWEEQGVLLLNSALTCNLGEPGSHVMIWRPFIGSLLKNLSYYTDLIYVFLGSQACTFKPYLREGSTILEGPHPAYFARNNMPLPPKLFLDINSILKSKYGKGIKWYKEPEYCSQEGE